MGAVLDTGICEAADAAFEIIEIDGIFLSYLLSVAVNRNLGVTHIGHLREAEQYLHGSGNRLVGLGKHLHPGHLEHLVGEFGVIDDAGRTRLGIPLAVEIGLVYALHLVGIAVYGSIGGAHGGHGLSLVVEVVFGVGYQHIAFVNPFLGLERHRHRHAEVGVFDHLAVHLERLVQVVIVIDGSHILIAVVCSVGNSGSGLVQGNEVHVFDGLHLLARIGIGHRLADDVSGLIVFIAVNLGRSGLLDHMSEGIVFVCCLRHLLHGKVAVVVESTLISGRLQDVCLVVEQVLGVVGQLIVAGSAVVVIPASVFGHTR